MLKFKNIALETINLFSSVGVFIVNTLIFIYKIFLSPLLPNTCKYYPTCSTYSIKSIKKHGLIKGGYFSIIRLLKCNPLSSGGIDLVKS